MAPRQQRQQSPWEIKHEQVRQVVLGMRDGDLKQQLQVELTKLEHQSPIPHLEQIENKAVEAMGGQPPNALPAYQRQEQPRPRPVWQWFLRAAVGFGAMALIIYGLGLEASYFLDPELRNNKNACLLGVCFYSYLGPLLIFVPAICLFVWYILRPVLSELFTNIKELRQMKRPIGVLYLIIVGLILAFIVYAVRNWEFFRPLFHG
jgi:hypothetical protein